jgi:hypothetical protein
VRGSNREQADLSTVRFVKRRESKRRHLYFVTYDATIPGLAQDTHSFDCVYPRGARS